MLLCPDMASDGCRRVLAVGPVGRGLVLAARLVLWASRSHTSTCRGEGSGRRDAAGAAHAEVVKGRDAGVDCAAQRAGWPQIGAKDVWLCLLPQRGE